MPLIPVEIQIDERWGEDGYSRVTFMWKSDVETLKKCLADTLISICLFLYQFYTESTEITYEKLTTYLDKHYGNIEMYYIINDEYENFDIRDNIELIQERYLRYIENSSEIEDFNMYKKRKDD